MFTLNLKFKTPKTSLGYSCRENNGPWVWVWPPPRIPVTTRTIPFLGSGFPINLPLPRLHPARGHTQGMGAEQLCLASPTKMNQQQLGGGLKDFLFSPLPGEMIQFD